ncbi:MAG: IS630 family transposase [Elusimicrobiota bacterium]
MPFKSRRAKLRLTSEEDAELTALAQSRTRSARAVERARILLAYVQGESVSGISRALGTSRPKVERCLDKALQFGAMRALADLPGRGREAVITAEARAWVVALACKKPKELGYSYELWTTRLLAEHVRGHCMEAGHPSLIRLGRGTVSKILSKGGVKPHKVQYYLDKRDPDFEAKMVQVLCVYKDVALLREKGQDVSSMLAVLSYDEKPGIQAIGNTSPDLPPVPGEHPTVTRDHEYVRRGTVSLMAGIDLLTGEVHGMPVDRHRSREFVDFLKLVDSAYPKTATVRMILDNHSAHISKETRAYLATVPNRFDFVFTPKHGSWLNIIESFFAKMAHTFLRGIRVSSKQELKDRMKQYLDEVNEQPTVFRWRYAMDSLFEA